MRKYWFKMMLFITFLLLIPGYTVQAADPLDYLPSGQIVEGPVIMAGERVRVDGIVDGDLYVAANDISITGEVTGDIIAAAQTISISGPVNGDLRLAAQTVRLQGITTGSATIFSQHLDFGQQAVIQRDMLVFTSSSRLEGDLQRNFKGGMEELYISGRVGKDLLLYDVGHLELDNAEIGGNISYRSNEKAIIGSGTVITGEEQWTKRTAPATEKTISSPWSVVGGAIMSLASLLLIWGVVKLWRPTLWQQIAQAPQKNLGSSAGLGILLLLATPLLAILLFITVIAIPVGIIILIIYSLALYLSILITAQYLAELLKPRLNYGAHDFWLILGLLILLMLVVRIPFLGWIIGLVILSIGVGSVFKLLFPDRNNPHLPDSI